MRLLFIIFLLLPLLGFGQAADSNYLLGEIYVKLKDSVAVPNVNKSELLNKSGELPFIETLLGNKSALNIEKSLFSPYSERLQRIYRIKLEKADEVELILANLNNNPIVEYAERVPAYRRSYIPNDYNTQYNYSLDKVDAENAWNITKGSSGIIVAVVDDAVQTNHEDLSANVVPGYDVANRDNDPTPPTLSYSHGTHVAGTVAATTDNGTGVASLGFNIKVMPVKAADGRLTDDGRLKITHGYEGVR